MSNQCFTSNVKKMRLKQETTRSIDCQELVQYKSAEFGKRYVHVRIRMFSFDYFRGWCAKFVTYLLIILDV